MSRPGMWAAALALAIPTAGFAIFPPVVNQPPPPPVTVTSVPPDPFKAPGVTSLGEPEPPPSPAPGPVVQTPEPASVVTALVGLAVAGGYGLRKRRQKAAM